MDEYISASFLRSKFLALIIIRSFSKAWLLCFVSKFTFPSPVFYSFWYLFPGGSYSEPVLMKLGGIFYISTLRSVVPEFSCVTKELFIIEPKRILKGYMRSHNIVLSLVALLHSLVPHWDSDTLFYRSWFLAVDIIF